jgi:hypothetical protein
MATTPNNAITQPGSQLTGLARQLVLNHLLDEPTAIKALEQSRRDNLPFVAYLVDSKLARDKDIARLVARSFNLPLFDIEALEIDKAIVQLVDENCCAGIMRCRCSSAGGGCLSASVIPPISGCWKTSSSRPGSTSNRSLSANRNGPRPSKALSNPRRQRWPIRRSAISISAPKVVTAAARLKPSLSPTPKMRR